MITLRFLAACFGRAALTRAAALIALAALSTGAQAQTFSNPAPITINDGQPASPYPSTVQVSGVSGAITDVNVTLRGFSHTYPDDVDVLLVGPQGQTVVLVSDVGFTRDVNGVTLTLDDEAADSLPDESQISSGTFKPTNFGRMRSISRRRLRAGRMARRLMSSTAPRPTGRGAFTW